MINIATVFSGIGAPEEALRQLNVDFSIIFASDNGERELTRKILGETGEHENDQITYEEILEDTKGMNYDDIQKYVKDLYAKTKKKNYVKASYFANHNISEDRWYEDMRFIDGTRYRGQVDILIGGSPCQSFSTYGKKKGFEDTRGTLFFHYAKLISDLKPKVFVYENVVGLLTHDKGKTWRRIQEIFNELNYDIQWSKLNAVDYGLPQKRERVFVVGFEKSYGIRDFKFPGKLVLETTVNDFLDEQVDKKYYLGKKGFEWVTTKEKHEGRSRVNRDIMCCQTANQQFNWTGDFRLEDPTDELRADKRIYVGRYKGEEKVARKLTPAECLKLMGFNDFKIVVKDVDAYRQSGNSIAVTVLKSLFEEIIRTIELE